MSTPRIDDVDAFYFRMPTVLDIGDGSQDLLLVRVRSGTDTGWGECEASPLTTLAAMVTPMSHSACHPVLDSVLGHPLRGVADITAVSAAVRARSADLLQADHAVSGIEIALWDLLGRREQTPVWSLLGYAGALPRIPYASALFANTPAETAVKARTIRAAGFRAAKFGWGPFGTMDVAADEAQVRAAREGLGADVELLVDAGTVFAEDVEAAAARLPVLAECRVGWFEEPFVNGALAAHRELAARSPAVPLAGGEGSHTAVQAEALVESGAVGFIQVDTGRIGGIGPSARVAAHAHDRGVRYVNHTFTTRLALAASLQPHAGLVGHDLCEFPVEASPLARALTGPALEPAADGTTQLTDKPGLGIDIDLDSIRPYLVDTEITVAGRLLYQTPQL